MDYVIEFTSGSKWYLTTRKDEDVSVIRNGPYGAMIRAIYMWDDSGKLIKV